MLRRLSKGGCPATMAWNAARVWSNCPLAPRRAEEAADRRALASTVPEFAIVSTAVLTSPFG